MSTFLQFSAKLRPNRNPTRRLPPALLPRPLAEKLLWRHVFDNPGPHSARSLAEDLGGAFTTWRAALAALLGAGLLTETTPPAGPKPGHYTAHREAQHGQHTQSTG